MTKSWRSAAVAAALAKRFPDLGFYFQPADIVSQILNFHTLPFPFFSDVSFDAGSSDLFLLALRERPRSRQQQQRLRHNHVYGA